MSLNTSPYSQYLWTIRDTLKFECALDLTCISQRWALWLDAYKEGINAVLAISCFHISNWPAGCRFLGHLRVSLEVPFEECPFPVHCIVHSLSSMNTNTAWTRAQLFHAHTMPRLLFHAQESLPKLVAVEKGSTYEHKLLRRDRFCWLWPYMCGHLSHLLWLLVTSQGAKEDM